MSKRIDDLNKKINFHEKVAEIASVGYLASGAGTLLSAFIGSGLTDLSKFPTVFAVMGGCALATFLSGSIADKNTKKCNRYSEMLSKEIEAQEILNEVGATDKDVQELADIVNKHQAFLEISRVLDDFEANNDTNTDIDSPDM